MRRRRPAGRCRGSFPVRVVDVLGGGGRAGRRRGQPGAGGGDGDLVADVVVAVVGGAGVGDRAGAVHLVLRLAGQLVGGVVAVAGGVVVGDAAVHALGQHQGDEPPG